MSLPSRIKISHESFPWLTAILVAVQVVAFLLMKPNSAWVITQGQLVGLDAGHVSPASILGHSFVNSTGLELLLHGFLMVIIMSVLEGKVGWVKCLGIYLAGVSVNAGLHLALSAIVAPTFLFLGPSGGLAAVVGASLAAFPHAKSEHRYRISRYSYTYHTFELPFWFSGTICFGALLVLGTFNALSLNPLVFVKAGALIAGIILAKLLGIKTMSAEASDAEASMADGEDYESLTKSELYALADSQPENPRITLALISRLISDRFQPDAALKKRFADQIPLFEKDEEMALSAGSILTNLKDASGLTMEQSLRVAMAADARGGSAAAKQLFDWVLHSSQADDDEKETAAFRLADLLEREGNLAGARELYAWLVKTYPFGSVTASSQARLAVLQKRLP